MFLFGFVQPGREDIGRPYSMLYVFGDSYSDIGAGYLDGNGPTAVAYLAANVHIPFTYFGDKHSEGKGIDFAVSGAQTGRAPGTRYKGGELLGRGMMNQVEDFVASVRSGKIKFDPAATMFFVEGGLNDKSLPTSESIANIEQEIDLLYGAGARRFLVARLPDEIPPFAEVGRRLNPALSQVPGQMRRKFLDIQIAESNWGAFFDRILVSPKEFGLTNVKDACAGRALFNEDATPCADPERHYFYHQGHPSTVVHRAVGDMLYQEALGK
jgi:phospholipase/lecithinase/hemolysin